MKGIIIIGIIFLLSLAAVNAATVSHSALQIVPGNFAVGSYNFPGLLTVGTALFVNASSGNVGVGTISPSSQLHIVNPSTSASSVALTMSANNGVGTVNNATIEYTSYGRILQINSGSAGEDMVLRAGNVGIGTTSPGNWKLNVAGGDNSFTWGGDHSSNDYIRIGNLQICWGVVVSSSWPKSVTFPVPFISVPTVTTSCPRSSYYTTIGSSDVGPTTTGFNFYVVANDGITCTASTHGHWIAIGQWQ